MYNNNISKSDYIAACGRAPTIFPGQYKFNMTSERCFIMHIFSHAGKHLLVAICIAFMSMTLICGRFVEANSTAGTPFSATVNPNPVVLRTIAKDLQADFSLDIIGVDPGSTINNFTDTADTPCIETINGTDISSASLVADANGRAYGAVHLDSCSSATPGVYSISATGSVNGIQISDQLLTTYTLKGTKVTITFVITVTTTTTIHAERDTVHK